jgi:hypothetical protein
MKRLKYQKLHKFLSRLTWYNNIKKDLKEGGWEAWTGLI